MDTKKALLVKTFRDFNNNHSFPQSQQQTRSTDIQEKDHNEVNLLYFAGTSENIVPFSTLKTLCVNYYDNQKMEKLTLVTAN